MKQILKLTLGAVFFTSIEAWADLYTAENIEISAKGATPVVAKNNAITEGEITAFNKVIRSLVGNQNNSFLERPSDDDILNMVRDISILDEKSTDTSYWGKINVRFNENAIQKYLNGKKQAILKKDPPVYWIIPVWKKKDNLWTLEDENPLYQLLKKQTSFSDFFKMVLPAGDLDELVRINQSIESRDLSDLSDRVKKDGAEKILLIRGVSSGDGSWVISPMHMNGADDYFSDLSVQGYDENQLSIGWQQLMDKMSDKWQSQNSSVQENQNLYYGRINVDKMTDWGDLERRLKQMDFLENLTLQGVMPKQILVSFSYEKGVDDLKNKLNRSGWTWTSSSSNLGTLEQKDTYNNENDI